MKTKKNIRRKRFYGIRKSCRIAIFALCVLSSAWSCGGDEKSNLHYPAKSNIQLSTKKEASLPSFKQPLLTKAEIKQIGEMHNELLGNILDKLQHKKNSLSHAIALEELSGIINDELDNFYRQTFDSGNKTSLSKRLLQTFKPYSKNDMSDSSPIQTMIKKDSARFSKAQIKLLLACDEVLNSASEVGLVLSKDKLNDIQKKAQAKLPAVQAQVVMIAAEVGKASLSYWHENINAWKKTLKNINPQQNVNGDGWFSWCKCSGADVAGASGAATALLPEAFVPGGQAAYVGEVAAWGAGASVCSAVGQIWEHYCCGCDTKQEKEDHEKENTHP